MLKYLKWTGEHGQPAPAPVTNNLTLNNVTVVPVERLTDEELAFSLRLAEKGRTSARDGHYDVHYRPPLVGVTFEPWRPGLPIR